MISLKDVSISFPEINGSVSVLKDINLQIEKGEKVIVWGASGSGKSTLLHIIGGILSPDKGTVAVNGKNLYGSEDVLSEIDISWVLPTNTLYPQLTVRENVELFLLGKSKEDTLDDIDQIFEDFNLTELLHRSTLKLSEGERQRIKLIVAFISKPQILILDEPTSSLDVNSKTIVTQILFESEYFKDSTFIIATHDPIFKNYPASNYYLENQEISKKNPT